MDQEGRLQPDLLGTQIDTIIIFLAKYLVYLLAAWTIASGWYISRAHGWRHMGFWLLKLGMSLILTYLGVKMLNNLFPSVRPFIVDGITPLTPHGNDPSFPSSHAADAAVFAYFIWSLRKDWGIVAFGLVGLIGAGRVLAHLHYPIDIVGGVVLGVLTSYLVLKFWPRKVA